MRYFREEGTASPLLKSDCNPVLSGCRVTRSLVFCVDCVDHCLSYCHFLRLYCGRSKCYGTCNYIHLFLNYFFHQNVFLLLLCQLYQNVSYHTLYQPSFIYHPLSLSALGLISRPSADKGYDMKNAM
jgi:hypothetical protein